MKVLLIALNAKFIHSCLAIHSLKAYAQANFSIALDSNAANPETGVTNPSTDDRKHATGTPGLLIETAEYTINQPVDDILSDICNQASKPACLIAFSCYIWNIAYVKKLALLISHAIPSAVIWVGGPEVTYCAETFLRENETITGVMTGEGEAVFTALLQAYAQGATPGCLLTNTHNDSPANTPDCSPANIYNRSPENNDLTSVDLLESVPGIVYRSKDQQILTNAPAEPLNLDTLVFPYSDQALLNHHILYYESSRGCPFGCSYCLSSIDRRVRFKSLPKVYAELTFFLEQRVPLVKFVDRTFNCDHERTLAIWQFLKEHDNGITRFHFEVTAELLNDKELALLSTLRPGLVQLEIGVQSANPDTLKAIDRSQDIGHLARITGQIRKGQNIHQHLDLIAGLPYEDLKSFSQSFDIVYSMQPDQLQLGFLKVLKGSKMHRLRDEYGLIYRPWPPYEVISTRWISLEELLLLKSVESTVETFYNSGQFRTTLTYLMHFFSRPWDFFLCFAGWMKENGQLGISHNRLQKYGLLREFIIKLCHSDFAASAASLSDTAIHSIDLQALDATLLYDLYLREKIKTRPVWAPDQTTQKERISSLYANEEIRRNYLSDFADDSIRQIRHETHIEIFPIDVKKTAETGGVITGEQILLFSYRKKNPLDGSAGVAALSITSDSVSFFS